MNHNASLEPILQRRGFLQSGAMLGSALLLGSLVTTASEDDKTAKPETDFWEVIKTRRSVRKFRSDPVPDEDLTKMIDMARLAATSGNQQPWKFLVIRDAEKISQLSEATAKTIAAAQFDSRSDKAVTREEMEKGIRKRMAGYFSAPAYIIVLTDNRAQYADYNHWDGPLAAGNLMLAARALGYGTVFITDAIPDRVTKDVFNIPDHYTRVCITPVGVPVAWPESPPKKKLEEFIAWEKL
jgi:nitroreductase